MFLVERTLPAIVRKIKSLYPDFPVLATGGPTEETIRETNRSRGKCHNLYTSIQWGNNECSYGQI